MPITPLHFGPALLVREVVGKKNFGIWAFTATQVAFDTEPAIRILFDLDGTLHQTTHNPTFGVIYALLAVALCWKWERWAAITGSVFGSVTHLWLDSMYHSDVAAMAATWGSYGASLYPAETEMLCIIALIVWGLVAGIRKARKDRLAKRLTMRPSRLDCQ